MKAVYDRTTDTLTLHLRKAGEVAESDETKPGVIIDYDAEGNVIGIEILDASRRVAEPNACEFHVAG